MDLDFPESENMKKQSFHFYKSNASTENNIQNGCI